MCACCIQKKKKRRKRVSIWLRQYYNREHARKKKGAEIKKRECMSILAKGSFGIEEKNVVHHNNSLGI
jgi:hypothetical protein